MDYSTSLFLLQNIYPPFQPLPVGILFGRIHPTPAHRSLPSTTIGGHRWTLDGLGWIEFDLGDYYLISGIKTTIIGGGGSGFRQ